MAEATRPASHAMEGETEAIIIEPGFLARNWWFLRRALVAAYEDNCFSIAKGAAYSFLLSLFPVLTTLTALLIRANAQSVVHVIATFVQQILPPGTENVVLSRLQERAGNGISLPIASILLSLWAGSGAMISLMEGFQAAYRIPSGRPFLKQRAMSIFLVLIAAVPAVASSSLIIFGNRIEGGFIHWLGVSEISAPVEILWRIGRYVVAFATTTFVTGITLLLWSQPQARTTVHAARHGVAVRESLAGCSRRYRALACFDGGVRQLRKPLRQL